MDDARELEILVARLEAVLSDYPLEITSPDFLPGRMSKTDREVDVSVRGAVGTVDLLVIFECRLRSRVEDVQWIEQLAIKCEDVGADKAVAVSSKGFSAAARSTAKAKCIDLRVISDLSLDDVNGWLRLSVLHVRITHSQVRHIDLTVNEPPSPFGDDVQFRHRGSEESLPLRSLATGDTHLLGDLVDVAVRSVDLDSLSGQRPNVRLTMSRADDPFFEVETIRGWHRVADLFAVVEVWEEKSDAPVTAVRRYASESGQMADVVEIEIEVGGKSHRVSFVHSDTGTQVTFESWSDNVTLDHGRR